MSATSEERRVRWWPLYAILLAGSAACALEYRLALSAAGHTLLRVLVVLAAGGLIVLWQSTQALALISAGRSDAAVEGGAPYTEAIVLWPEEQSDQDGLPRANHAANSEHTTLYSQLFAAPVTLGDDPDCQP